MLLPCAPFHSLPFLGALWSPVASLLLGAILLLALILPLLLLGVLLLPALVLPLLLLGTLRVLLPRGRLLLLLSMLWVGLGLLLPALLMFVTAFLLVLLFLLCVRRNSDSEKQRQSCCADNSN